MIALRNFSCEGIKKEKGQEIKPDEEKKMGKFLKQLVDDGIIGEKPSEPKKEESKKDSKK